ncbi:MAG TPA: tetratricopeptide repeat protein, partial [Pyrinomonadaceae bacterium]|nr:tetratricopeptide repeat protein [Pyrinomonadaceae bacterium]
LSTWPSLAVKSRASVFRYKGREVDPQRAGEELGVRAVLTGRVAQRGDALTVSVELVDVRRNNQVWGAQYNRRLSDILALQDEIARDISDNLRTRLTGEAPPVVKQHTQNTEAYRLYLQGRFHENKETHEGVRKAVEHFNQAIALDPNYALAHAGLANAYVTATDWFFQPKESLPRAKAAAERALQLDDSLAEAHHSMALVRMFYDRDWAAAENECRRAIELAPGFASAHEMYAELLAMNGRHEESVAAATRARELDPLSADGAVALSDAFYYSRQYERAAEELRRVIEIEPGHVTSRLNLAVTLSLTGRHDESIELLRKARRLDDGPDVLAYLAYAYAAAGRRADARRALNELTRGDWYVSPFYLAMVHAGLGDTERAFASLERAVEEQAMMLSFLKVEPVFDPLRPDPRFDAILRRVNLKPN